MTETINVDEAYMAMFRFLQRLFEHTGDDYLAALLPGMQLVAPGHSLDPDCLISFREAVALAKEGKIDIQLRLTNRPGN